MFTLQNTFTAGWHLVRIIDAKAITVKGQYDALSLEFKNSAQVRQSFLIFINNWMLIKQLLDVTYDQYDANEEFDEKDFIDMVLYVNLEEKNNLLVITAIREYIEDETA